MPCYCSRIEEEERLRKLKAEQSKRQEEERRAKVEARRKQLEAEEEARKQEERRRRNEVLHLLECLHVEMCTRLKVSIYICMRSSQLLTLEAKLQA